MDKLGIFLQGLAQVTREGIIAKKLAAFVAKKALRAEGLMPEQDKKVAKAKK